jgi:RNA polymerase sigma-70 factor (ECF subfamily)
MPRYAPELTLWGRIGESAESFSGSASMVEPHENALRPAASVAKDADREDAVRSNAAGGDVNRAISAVMDRYAQGDDAAFDELYRLASPRIRGFLVRLSGDMALADDLTQETFLRVHRARGAFAAGAAAVPWILAIARNALRDSARRAQARPKLRANAPDDEAPTGESPPDERGDEVLAAREMLGIVERTLAAMPSLHREAFVLLRFEGLSVNEAAAVLGATEGAVKVRAFRAYEALREALGGANGRRQ